MGFAGYVSICVQLYFAGFHADKHTRKETTKITKEKQK
jgi:hypothetical protein